MKDNQYLSFVLANTDNGYVLTTFKIGTIMIQSNATDFLQFCIFDSSKNKIVPVNEMVKRPSKGKPKDVAYILKNEHITCLVRDPSERTYTGIVQELLGYESNNYPGVESLKSVNPIITFLINNYFFPFKKERLEEAWDLDKTIGTIPISYLNAQYTVRDLIGRWLDLPEFRKELANFFKEAVPIYWHILQVTAHIQYYHKLLYEFIHDGYIKKYSIKHLNELSFKYDNDGYRHSNKVFLPAIYDAFDYLMNKNNYSTFQGKYNKFIGEEWYHYRLLTNGEKKENTKNG